MCHSVPTLMGFRHRLHLTSPVATRGAHTFLSAWFCAYR